MGRWGGSGCGGLIGRVVWTVGWLLPAAPHPVVVWEVVVNKECGMWSHRDGFPLPGVVWSGLVWSGGVGVGWWDGSGCGGLMGPVVWTVGWFLPVVPHPVVVWEVVVNKDCGMWSHRDGFPGVVWSGLVWSGGVGVGRWGGSGCGGLMGRVVWTVVWFLPAVPHPVVVWEVVVNTDCGMWSHRDGFPGVVWSGLVWSGGVGVGRWGCSGCGGLMGRVVWTVGRFHAGVVSAPPAGWLWMVGLAARGDTNHGLCMRERGLVSWVLAIYWHHKGGIRALGTPLGGGHAGCVLSGLMQAPQAVGLAWCAGEPIAPC